VKLFSKFTPLLALVCCTTMLFGQGQSKAPKLHGYFTVRPAPNGSAGLAPTRNGLPLWSYDITSTRDGNNYSGVMVGTTPFDGGNATTRVPTQIIPVIVKVHRIATSLNDNFTLNTRKGEETFNPTVPNTQCLTAPNDIPLKLVVQSPIFRSVPFSFGGTYVGTTQYVDAFQRANFWDEIGPNYHVKLAPVQVLEPIVIDVPNDRGLSLAKGIFGSCGPLGIFDINYMDSLLTNKIIPSLASRGVTPGTFPIFLMANTVLSFGNPRDLNQCCVLGYHGATGSGALQTYSPADFDTTGLFGPDSGDTSTLSHEVAEWMDDPTGNNPTPAWGHIGQVPGCQSNLEVGDPLSGTDIPPVTMPNGFTYHLQELAFFNWFYGGPSFAVNHWFSDNGTFTTDAGPPCE
jgi:hypothetical protein